MQYKIWNGGSAIVIKDNHVLMVRTKNSNSWGVPSGGVEVGETAKETCIREVLEETGYEATIVKELHTKKTIIKDYKVTTQYFLCEVTGGEIRYHDPDEEIEEISWKNRSEISTLQHTYPEDKEMIEQLLDTMLGADKLTNLYFVRHAHSTYTPDELNRPLSEKGFIDAKMVTKLLKAEKIGIVVSSPYKRAIQTVQGIAEYINTEVEIIDGFKERTLTTIPANDFTVAIAKVWEDYNFSWEGGESNFVAQKRGIETTFNILEKYKGENVVIGTHGNIMVLIMNFFNRLYDFSFWQNLDMPDIYKLTFDGKVLRNVERLWERI